MKRFAIIIFAVCLLATTAARAGFDDHFAESGDIGEYKVPHEGLSRILVVPVIIDNLDTPDLAPWSAFFENKLDALTFRNYWHVNSLGRYNTEVRMIEPIHYADCPLPEEFTNCRVPRGDIDALAPAIDFVKELLERARDEQGLNFADFDLNGSRGVPDGWADGILIITNADISGVALPMSLFKNIKIHGVQIGGVGFLTFSDHEVIALHEFGHLLGFADLYHEQKQDRGAYLSLMGEYSHGIPLLDAYSRMKIGWADVVDVDGPPESLLIPPAIVSGRVIRIGGESEFYLVENRTPGEFFDADLEKPGLAIYHIDESLLPEPGEWTFIQLVTDCLNCDEWHPFIMNEQPDGKFRIQRGESTDPNICLFRGGQSFKPDYLSQNPITDDNAKMHSNWYSGEPSDVLISDINDKDHLPAIRATVGYD